MNLAPKYEVALLQSIQSCFEISNYFSLILYRCKDYPIDHRCTYFVDYVHGSSLNRNYNALFTPATAAFQLLCWENTTTVSDNGQKKKWQGVPPKIKVSTKKTSQTNQKKIYLTSKIFSLLQETGTSANAGPHYQKLYARVTHIWGNRGGQSNRSAMKRPRPGRTALVITVPPASGKYDLIRDDLQRVFM